MAEVVTSTFEVRPSKSNDWVTKEASPFGSPEFRRVSGFERRAFARDKVKSSHQHKQENSEREEGAPNAFDIFADRRRLIFVDADRFRRATWQIERFPDVCAIGVFAEGPCHFVGGFFRGENARRLDVFGYRRMFADADLPGKFAKDDSWSWRRRIESACRSRRDNLPTANWTIGSSLQTLMSFQWPLYSVR